MANHYTYDLIIGNKKIQVMFIANSNKHALSKIAETRIDGKPVESAVLVKSKKYDNKIYS